MREDDAKDTEAKKAMPRLSDTERVARAKEVRPGVMAAPWEKGHCEHGRIYSYRWTWRVGGTIECGGAEFGSSRCKQCQAE